VLAGKKDLLSAGQRFVEARARWLPRPTKRSHLLRKDDSYRGTGIMGTASFLFFRE